MAGYNSALYGAQYVQQNAQGALPVVPNNGNPNGAYNMPAAPQQLPVMAAPAQPPTLADRYPWLKPSPSMDNVRQLLANRAAAQQPAAPVMQQPTQQATIQHRLPVMPMQRM